MERRRTAERAIWAPSSRYLSRPGLSKTSSNFTGTAGPAPGRFPVSRLLLNGAGTFIGTAPFGGVENLGTIFKITNGTFSTVRDFVSAPGAHHGVNPAAGLVNDGNGFFWGTTANGGSANFGTIYKVAASTGALTTVREPRSGTCQVSAESPRMLGWSAMERARFGAPRLPGAQTISER